MSEARRDIFTVEEGVIVLQYPSPMSSSSFEFMQRWMEIEMRKLRRIVALHQQEFQLSESTAGAGI